MFWWRWAKSSCWSGVVSLLCEQWKALKSRPNIFQQKKIFLNRGERGVGWMHAVIPLCGMMYPAKEREREFTFQHWTHGTQIFLLFMNRIKIDYLILLNPTNKLERWYAERHRIFWCHTVCFVPLLRNSLKITLPILHIQEAHLPVLPLLLVHVARERGIERERERERGIKREKER